MKRAVRRRRFHVFPEIGMVQHPLERGRMEHLQQEGAHAAHHHRHDIGMNHADGAVRFEQGMPGGHDGRFALAAIVEYGANLPHEQVAQGLGGPGNPQRGHGVTVPQFAAPEQRLNAP